MIHSRVTTKNVQGKQNILVQVVVWALWTCSSLNIYRDLHWLPVGHHITYKLCFTTRKTLHTCQLLYLSELISRYIPSRSLHSSNANLLGRPAGITGNFSSRAFSVSAPSTWNSLPAHIRSIDTLSTFNRHLKFRLFQSAFTVQSSCASASDSFSRFLALNINWGVCMYAYMHVVPSVLWRCWLGGRKGIQPVKNWVVRCWHGYLSAARCTLAYGPADVTATHCLLLQ